MGFSRQEHLRGLPFPLPGDLPNPGIKSTSFKSPSLAGKLFTTVTIWEALMYGYSMCIVYAMSCAYDVCVTYMYEWTCNMCTVTAGLWLLLAEALEGLVLLLTCFPCKMHYCSCLAESQDVKMEWDLNHLFWGVRWDTEEMNHCSRLGSAEPGKTPVLWIPQLMLLQ